jgi:hypothetical protein
LDDLKASQVALYVMRSVIAGRLQLDGGIGEIVELRDQGEGPG